MYKDRKFVLLSLFWYNKSIEKFTLGALILSIISLHDIIKVRNVKISSMDSTKANPIASRVGFFLRPLRLRTCGLATTCA